VKLQKDLREFIELLNSQGVEYLVVGGHAVGFHGYPRYTGDIDFWVKPSEANAARLVEVFKAFGFADGEKIGSISRQPGKMMQLGLPPNRIDVLTSISGLEFEDAWLSSLPGKLGGLPVRFPNLASLLQNKRSSARPKDLADVDELERVANTRGSGRDTWLTS